MSGDDTHELDLGREALVSFSSRAAMMAFGFAGIVLFARVLGPAGLGAYYLVLAGGRTLAQVTNGVGNAVKKRASEGGSDPREFLAVGLSTHLCVSAAVGVFALLADPVLRQVVDVPHLVLSLTAIVFSLGLFHVTNALYAGIGYPGYASWADTVRSVLTLLFQVGFIVAGWGAFGLVLGFAGATFLTGLGVWVASGVVPRLPSRAVVRSTASFARWSVPNSLVADVYGRADILLIGVLVGNTAVGFYETALRLVQPGAFFATSITNPLLVKVSGLSSRDLDVLPDLENAVSYAGLLAVPILFGAAAMPQALMVTVFGGEFSAAWPALVGLGVFQVLSSYAKPFEQVMSGTDRMRFTFGVSGLVLLVYAPMAVGLGYLYGLVGVVAATVASEVVRLGVYQLLARRVFDGSVRPRPVADQLLAGAAMGATVAAVVDSVIVVRGWPYLIVAVSLGAVVYFAVLTVLSRHFRETVGNVSPVPLPYSR